MNVSTGLAGGKAWRITAVLLLAVSLCLGSITDLLAGPTLQAQTIFGGEICHSPRPDETKAAESDTPKTAHNCCVYCHTSPTAELTPPMMELSAPSTPPTFIGYTPAQTRMRPSRIASHNQARAPPRL